MIYYFDLTDGLVDMYNLYNERGIDYLTKELIKGGYNLRSVETFDFRDTKQICVLNGFLIGWWTHVYHEDENKLNELYALFCMMDGNDLDIDDDSTKVGKLLIDCIRLLGEI